jgi:hypothetical protein
MSEKKMHGAMESRMDNPETLSTSQRHWAQVRDTEHKSETLSTSQREKTNKTKSTTKKTKNISSTDSTKKPGMNPGASEEPAASVTHRKSR